MDPSGRGWKAEPGPDIFEHIRKVFSEDHDFIAIGSTGLELQSDICFKVHLKLACFSCLRMGSSKLP